jgi:hypothetical protein
MTWIAIVLLVLVGYIIANFVHRLWFSPLRDVPGPKLAAVTGWYEAYYDLFKGCGGQYTWKIKELHEQYGPV